MKKVVAIAMLAFFFGSCNNHDHSEKKETSVSSGADHQHMERSGTLELNKGLKWKADSNTNNNVEKLQAVISGFDASADTSIRGFSKAAVELQQGLDKMIKECKMSGPGHDALHKWLEPLAGQIKGLKETTTFKDASSQMEEISKHLQLYAQYFE